METQNINHRLLMIQDDLKAIREFITTNNLQDRFDLPSSRADKAITHLNNIEIACDLNSDECLSWKQYSKAKPTNKIETEFKLNSTPDTYFEVVRFITEFTNRDEYNPEKRRNPIEIAHSEEGWSKLYDLAIKWSEEFNKLNKNREWNGEFVDEVEEFCKKKNSCNQWDLMSEIRAKLDINIVTCGHCGGVLLHRNDDYIINCSYCDTLMDSCDCPDLIY